MFVDLDFPRPSWSHRRVTAAWARVKAVWAFLTGHGWIVIVVAGAVGIYGLQDSLGWGAAIPAAAVAVLAAFAKFNEVAGRLLGAIVVGTLALLGFNVVVDHLTDRMPIVLGLFLAVIVFSAGAGWYLRGMRMWSGAGGWGRGRPWHGWVAWATTGALGVLLIVDVPIVVGRTQHADLTPGEKVGLVFALLAGVAVAVPAYYFGHRLAERGGWRAQAGGIAVAVLGTILMG